MSCHQSQQPLATTLRSPLIGEHPASDPVEPGSRGHTIDLICPAGSDHKDVGSGVFSVVTTDPAGAVGQYFVVVAPEKVLESCGARVVGHSRPEIVWVIANSCPLNIES